MCVPNVHVCVSTCVFEILVGKWGDLKLCVCAYVYICACLYMCVCVCVHKDKELDTLALEPFSQLSAFL